MKTTAIFIKGDITTIFIKGGIISNLIKDQIKLIEPLIKDGTTKSIRDYAISEYDKLNNLLILEKKKEDTFLKENKDTLINCCMSLYNKLNDDYKILPTVELRELAKKEADNIMEIWKVIEKYT